MNATEYIEAKTAMEANRAKAAAAGVEPCRVRQWPTHWRVVRHVDFHCGMVEYEWGTGDYNAGGVVEGRYICTIDEFAADLKARDEYQDAHRDTPERIEPLTTASVERDLYEAVKACEWSARRQGPGSGPMFSGGDGAMVPACGACGGIHPQLGGSMFREEVLGHRPNCRIGRFLAKVESARAAVKEKA